MEQLPRRKTIVCDVGALDGADLEIVDALGRLALAVRRSGGELRLLNASPGLRELIDWLGLLEALGVQAVGEPEQGEQARGVEEHGELADPAA
jgi:hypothetical protein